MMVKLTPAERDYLLWLMDWNLTEGTHYGNQSQYLKRYTNLVIKLGGIPK